MRPKYLPRFILLFLFRVLLLPFCFFVQNIEANEAGAIIVLSSKGIVNAISPTGQVVPSILKSGTVLAEGFSIKTGLTGETSILFSNGTTASIEPNSQIKISSFTQTPFSSRNRKLGELQSEPSQSKLSLDLDLGALVVQTIKLNKGSTFTINSSLGTAGIRGTEFQMGLSPAGNLNLDVSSSVVAFTPPGSTLPVLISKGNGLSFTKGVGVVRRSIDAKISQNISNKNKSAKSVANNVALSVIQVASDKAKQLSTGDKKAPMKKSKSTDQENDPDSDSESEKDDSKVELLERSSNAPRSVPPAETYRETYREKINNLLGETANSDSRTDEAEGNVVGSPPSGGPLTPPPTVNPDSPPTNPPGEETDPSAIASLTYEYSKTNQSLIFNYLDEGGVILSSSQLPVSDSNYESISSMLNPLKKNQDNHIDVLGIQVFMEELVLNPSKYNNLNQALHDAIQLSRIFLTDLNIENSLPGGNVWNAQRLVGQFASNPYAYEFGQLLIKHGAFGESGNSEITNIGNQIVDILGGRNKLADSNYLNTLSSKLIQPGDTYNGKSLNGNLLGTRDGKFSENDAKLLQIGSNNVNGVIGSKITIKPPSGSSKASIDVSPYLTKASSSEDKKVFAIAAVKDLHIEGDVDFKNSNHSEDHALSIGAADDIHIKEGSKIYNEGSNLGIGSYDTLQLLNVDIDTGGNLALASLEELHIRSTKPDEESALSSTFSVGRYSDSDNLYLYADQLINVDGLRFSGNLREVYMEAITIDLKNINFPSNSEVMLRSKDGYPTFGSSNRMVGAVNFIENVKHGSRSINSVQDFNTNGSSGYDSKIMSGNSAAIKIRKFSN
jgi:hypothetical protein